MGTDKLREKIATLLWKRDRQHTTAYPTRMYYDTADQILALLPDREEVKVAWIKALMKEGILVAEPKDLAGIRNRLVEEAKREGYTIGFEEARKKYELDKLP